MPFTFSHPTYAFPLKYIIPKLSLTGLVLGSMAPDFEYFIMLEPHASIGHTLPGLFLHAIPLSILFAFAFHWIIKEQLAIHLPSILHIDRRAYSMCGDWRLVNLKEWFLFIVSVVIGFISHITLDAFTHVHGYFVLKFPILSQTLLLDLPLYKLLQYSLSILGLLLLIVILLHNLSSRSFFTIKMPKVTVKQKIIYWGSVMLFTIGITSVKLLLTNSDNLIGILVVAPISGMILGLFFTSLVMKLLNPLRLKY